jgi:molybdopterin converting factor small subunit
VNIHIRYFAAFREAAGIDSESVVTEAISPADLFSECAVRHAELQNYSSSLVAINDEIVSWNSALSDNDQVLFFPPVAGG